MIKAFIEGFITGLHVIFISIVILGFALVVLLPFFLIAEYGNFLWLLTYIFIILFLVRVYNIIYDKLEVSE